MYAALLVMALIASDKVVVVTATAGFRHSSIETAEQVIADLGARTRLEITFARDEEEMAAALSAESLRDVKLVIFANTTGDLKLASRAALFDWVRAGGSFIGTHSASDTWHESPEYIDMLGGEFETHPDQALRTIVVADRDHPATSGLTSPHALFKEYYVFKNFARERVHLLLALDSGDPIAWYRAYGSGRVFYTALGHREDVWTAPWFQQHLSGAIAWALRREMVPRRRTVRVR